MQTILSQFSSSEVILLVLVFILFTTVVGLLVLLIRGTARTYELTYPVYEYTVKRAEKRAQNILHGAIEKSREMIVDAELRGTKAIAREKVEYKKAEEAYLKRFDSLARESEEALKRIQSEATEHAHTVSETLAKHLSDMSGEFENTRSTLSEYTKNTQEQLQTIVAGVRQTLSDDLGKSETAIREEVEKVSAHMEATAEKLQSTFSKELGERIQSAFKSAEKSAETYRIQQNKILDEHILGIIEKTTSIALDKKLSLSDHADLVKRALKKAKEEGIFVES